MADYAGKTKYWIFVLKTRDPARSSIPIKRATRPTYATDTKSASRARPHLQGYIEMINRKTMIQMKHDINPRCKWLPRGGTALEAATYAKKDNTGIYEDGVLSKSDQGKRNDMAEIFKMIENGADEADICRKYPGQFIRYHAGITKAISLQFQKRVGDIEIYYIYGKTGSGKTSSVVKKEGEALYHTYDQDLRWFDGYKPSRHSAILIDEFNGSQKAVFYNKILDRYTPWVEVKGAKLRITAKRIYICSNYKLKEVANTQGWSPEELEQFKRRVTKFIHVERLPGAPPVDIWAPLVPQAAEPTTPVRPQHPHGWRQRRRATPPTCADSACSGAPAGSRHSMRVTNAPRSGILCSRSRNR
ncbi:replication associated protein [Lake Sarah-associated circular molecule 1]|uniref:replication associated protein n=1 Tax=Lake Sarah-associated circular molecule 1 TaxID=1685724 RepID=UPI00077812B7|nr:replication associated protein [Lake Sarah-associated circular molecule 1]ALE29537.1 replication associated protein [Lake Sarah-associated circular molecule 1]